MRRFGPHYESIFFIVTVAVAIVFAWIATTGRDSAAAPDVGIATTAPGGNATGA